MKARVIGHDGNAVELQLKSALSLPQRLRGLLSHTGLAPAQGLWIAPCNSVHSFFMRFAIDVVYLDRQQRIVHIRPQLQPWRMSLHLSAHSVIELAAGECQRLNIQIGDSLQCAQPV